MTHRTGRYELQEYIADQWITFSSEKLESFAVRDARRLSHFKDGQFRVWDSQENKVVGKEK